METCDRRRIRSSLFVVNGHFFHICTYSPPFSSSAPSDGEGEGQGNGVDDKMPFEAKQSKAKQPLLHERAAFSMPSSCMNFKTHCIIPSGGTACVRVHSVDKWINSQNTLRSRTERSKALIFVYILTL